jgi:hypothetical protein
MKIYIYRYVRPNTWLFVINVIMLTVVFNKTSLCPVLFMNRIFDIMVSVLALRSVGLGQYIIGTYCFFAKHATLKSNSKNQDNVSEWNEMSTRRLLFH